MWKGFFTVPHLDFRSHKIEIFFFIIKFVKNGDLTEKFSSL